MHSFEKPIGTVDFITISTLFVLDAMSSITSSRMEVSKVFTSLLKFVGRANTTKSVSSKKLLGLFLKSKFIGFLSRYFVLMALILVKYIFLTKKFFYLCL